MNHLFEIFFIVIRNCCIFEHMKQAVLLYFSLLTLLFSIGCRKEKFTTDPSAKLKFSTDTVFFDTVFTAIGSATYRFTVINDNEKSVAISKISLKEGANSKFRINVDGLNGNEQTDVSIRGKDSIFIFVEVTVDPNDLTSPFVIEDAIEFETNGNKQDVKLVAWGQNAYFYYNVSTGGGGNAFELPVDKPSVIYGYFIVDSADVFTIPQGASIHMHSGAILFVYKEASLHINGTAENPVIIQGDRLEDSYKEDAGQWERIWLYATSVNNTIDYAIIKNGNIGVQVDTVGNSSSPTLTINNTIITNMAGVGLLAQGSKVVAENCQFTNCGQYTAALALGGEYEFRHCSFGNYWSGGTRNNGQILLKNYYIDAEDNVQPRSLNKAYFGNCIIYGNNKNEIEFDFTDKADSVYRFETCILKMERDTADANEFQNIIYNPGFITVDGTSHDPVFDNPTDLKFNLFDQSIAIDKANIAITGGLNIDILGKNRDTKPDIGAYEFVP